MMIILPHEFDDLTLGQKQSCKFYKCLSESLNNKRLIQLISYTLLFSLKYKLSESAEPHLNLKIRGLTKN